MRSLSVLGLTVLASCNSGQAGAKLVDEPPGERLEQAFIVPPDKLVPAEGLARAVRQVGLSCESVSSFAQLDFNGRPLDNYKLDCPGHSYLVTFLDGGSRIRPWREDNAASSREQMRERKLANRHSR